MPENKSYLDTFTGTKPESFNKETFVPVRMKNKRIKIIIAIIAVVVLLVGSFTVYNSANHVKIPELVDMTIEEANVWATKNRIILATKSVYDLTAASGVVVSQEMKAGNSIAKNSAMTIEVSLGADPNEKITWPDIKSMTTNEIKTWISGNKLTGVKIVSANSDIVAADKVVSYTLTDDTEANFTRKSRATINVSIGSAALSDTVIVIDFSTMKSAAILQWGYDNGIAVYVSEAYDDYIAAGNVISQSIKAATEIKRTVAISVAISIGKQVLIPDFSALSQTEAVSWAKINNITLTILEKYSSVAKGRFIAQSIAADVGVKESSQLILTYSLGDIEMTSFVKKTKLDMLSWLMDVNAKGADITAIYTYANDPAYEMNVILDQSIMNTYISVGTTVTFNISWDPNILIPTSASTPAPSPSI